VMGARRSRAAAINPVTRQRCRFAPPESVTSGLLVSVESVTSTWAFDPASPALLGDDEPATW
jgi:hypothetical protein